LGVSGGVASSLAFPASSPLVSTFLPCCLEPFTAAAFGRWESGRIAGVLVFKQAEFGASGGRIASVVRPPKESHRILAQLDDRCRGLIEKGRG